MFLLLHFRMNRKPSISELMRRKSIPAAAAVLMSSAIERCNIDTCLRTETLYMDNENSMTAEIPEQIIQEDIDQPACSADVPSMF